MSYYSFIIETDLDFNAGHAQGLVKLSIVCVINTAYFHSFSSSFSQCALVLNEKKTALNTY